MVATEASMAQAASTALPPFWKIMAPVVAPSGLPVMAIQWRPWSGGLAVRWAEAAGGSSAPSARTRDIRRMVPPLGLRPGHGGGDLQSLVAFADPPHHDVGV